MRFSIAFCLAATAVFAQGVFQRPSAPAATGKPPTPATTPATTPAKKPTAAASAASATTGTPSYKDLKFPPLGAIETPKIDVVTLPNGIRLYLLEDRELPLIQGTALVRPGNFF